MNPPEVRGQLIRSLNSGQENNDAQVSKLHLGQQENSGDCYIWGLPEPQKPRPFNLGFYFTANLKPLLPLRQPEQD
jgi:hypothetical protein